MDFCERTMISEKTQINFSFSCQEDLYLLGFGEMMRFKEQKFLFWSY